VIDTSSNTDSLKQDRSKVIPLLTLALIFGICAATSLMSPTLKGDEQNYHFPLSLKFASEFPKFDFITNYSSANAPLPYVLVATVMQVFGTHVYVARATTMIVSLTCLFLFASVAKKLHLSHIPLLTGLLFLQPHFIGTSFVFYTPLYGMVFALGFLAVWIHEGRKHFWYYCKSGMLVSLAILSQQFYLMFIAAFMFDAIAQGWHSRGIKANEMWSGLGFLIPLALPALLFYSWHGLVLPEFAVHGLSLRLDNIVFFLIFLGFYFFPVALQGMRTISGRQLVPLVGALAFFFLFRPVWSQEHTASTITGPVLHLCSMLSGYIPRGELVGQIILYLLGSTVVLHALSKVDTLWQRKLCIAIACLVGGLAFLEHFAEKYLLTLVPMLILLVYPMLKNRKHLILWYIAVGIFGIAYFFQLMLVKYG
jgi:4-amino-4-deoxy-L-arabinose transferase-like glycosyltransferase